MKTTFAIITGGDQDDRINQIITSIVETTIPEYEILVVGGMSSTIDRPLTRHLQHDERFRPGWITGKKNIATQNARYDNIVYLHDYHVFDSSWYRWFVDFGDDWDIQSQRVLTINGHRCFDWVILDHPTIPIYTNVPYDRHDLIPYQYISGGYFVSKKRVMMEEPLDERLISHQAEDVEWSKRIRNKYRIKMNSKCVVRHNKHHREVEAAGPREERSILYFT